MGKEFMVGGRQVSSEVRMSALGQKRTSRRLRLMSALPPKADIGTQSRNVRFVPKADICSAANSSLFDHLVGTGDYRRWYREAEPQHFRLRHFRVNSSG
jgi:hypothetical protein